MPGILQQQSPETTLQLDIKELHPTFGAEIDNVKLADLSDDDFKRVLELMAKAWLQVWGEALGLGVLMGLHSTASSSSVTQALPTQPMSSSPAASATSMIYVHT